MRLLLPGLLLAILQAPPPASEIYLLPLEAAGGRLVLGKPLNVSNSPGYDNQPFFTSDGSGLLFTSGRSPGAPAGAAPQTDIYRYDLAGRAVRQVTDTPESEYSPTVTPDGKGISVIQVEADGTQRLWRFEMDGSTPRVLLPEVKPVGYHAWIDEHRLALFILGREGAPATLQLADTRTGKAEVRATDIGRSIQRIPSGGISFVLREPAAGERPARAMVMRFDPDAPRDRQVRPLVEVPAGVSQPDLAWIPDGTLLLAHGGRLHAWRAGASRWSEAADLAALGLQGATRLAVSPKGDWLAIVANGR